MKTIEVVQMEREDLKVAMSDVLSEIVKDSILAPYEGRLVDSKTARQILRISEATLYRYVDSGLLQPWDRSARTMQFDLRYLLEFNIKQVKNRKQFSHGTIS